MTKINAHKNKDNIGRKFYMRHEIKKKKHDINTAGKLPKNQQKIYKIENIIFTTNLDLLESSLVKKELDIPFWDDGCHAARLRPSMRSPPQELSIGGMASKPHALHFYKSAHIYNLSCIRNQILHCSIWVDLCSLPKMKEKTIWLRTSLLYLLLLLPKLRNAEVFRDSKHQLSFFAVIMKWSDKGISYLPFSLPASLLKLPWLQCSTIKRDLDAGNLSYDDFLGPKQCLRLVFVLFS